MTRAKKAKKKDRAHTATSSFAMSSDDDQGEGVFGSSLQSEISGPTGLLALRAFGCCQTQGSKKEF